MFIYSSWTMKASYETLPKTVTQYYIEEENMFIYMTE